MTVPPGESGSEHPLSGSMPPKEAAPPAPFSKTPYPHEKPRLPWQTGLICYGRESDGQSLFF